MTFLTAAGGDVSAVQAGLVAQLFPLFMVLVAFYFFLVRPQQQQQKQREKMLSALKRGDKILTIGGLHGEIVSMRDDVLTVRLAENVEVRMSRSGVSRVLE
ncbi:MAG: preprotein translocase subunit YajC [Firmicutes bacterium]|nr:preprotein translocase subunit YajC [Bacillota bacterium]